ncbi:MAG TPA: glyoxalase superfamily protein, partial [Terriglobia bacterium]|nr:glyoxalase superfamily protein [Terriglobia bacterium]
IEGEHRFASSLPLYLFLRRGDVRLHLSEHRGDARPGTLVYFWVTDVDQVAAEFGAKVVDQPWARQVDLTDPDGNRLRIGQRSKEGQSRWLHASTDERVLRLRHPQVVASRG